MIGDICVVYLNFAPGSYRMECYFIITSTTSYYAQDRVPGLVITWIVINFYKYKHPRTRDYSDVIQTVNKSEIKQPKSSDKQIAKAWLL